MAEALRQPSRIALLLLLGVASGCLISTDEDLWRKGPDGGVPRDPAADRSVDLQPSDSRLERRPPDGPRTDGRLPDGRPPDSRPPDARPPDSRPPDKPCIPLTLTFLASGDSFVEEIAPTVNHGSDTELRVDQAPDERAYLRFNVSGLSGAVIGTKLRLDVTNESLLSPAIYATATTWNEGSITWDSQPTPGAKIADLASASLGWNEFDLPGAITGNGTYAFVIMPVCADGLDFYSREYGGNEPALLVTIGCN